MNAASPSLPLVGRYLERRWLPSAEVVALARIEGRRLLCHPAFLVGLTLSVLMIVAGNSENDGGLHMFLLSGFAFLPLAAGTLVVGNLAALRSRRDATDELYGTLPRPRSSRTAGQLLGLAWTLPASGFLVAAAYVAFGAGAEGGFVVNHIGARHSPAVVELAQGPLMVVAFGAIGILLARVAPSPIVAALMIVAIWAVEIPTAVWGSAESTGAWLVPMSNHAMVQPGSWVPCKPGDTVPGCNLVLGYDVSGMTGHLIYLVGMTVLAGAAALVGRRRRYPLAVLAAALVLATALGVG